MLTQGFSRQAECVVMTVIVCRRHPRRGRSPSLLGMPAPTRSTDEERSVQQPDASAPLYSLQPPQEVGCSTSSAKQTVAWYRDLPVSL